jgi:hypothetical protein
MVFAGLVAGCTLPLDVIILNRSGAPVAITQGGGDHTTRRVEVGAGATANLRGLLSRPFQLGAGQRPRRYTPGFVEEAFVEYRGWGPFSRRVVKAQLEPNGCIYLVPIAQTLPVATHVVQPDGYPLCSSREEGTNHSFKPTPLRGSA